MFLVYGVHPPLSADRLTRYSDVTSEKFVSLPAGRQGLLLSSEKCAGRYSASRNKMRGNQLNITIIINKGSRWFIGNIIVLTLFTTPIKNFSVFSSADLIDGDSFEEAKTSFKEKSKKTNNIISPKNFLLILKGATFQNLISSNFFYLKEGV